MAWTGAQVFLPQGQDLLSFGVVKAADARPGQIALEGLLFPTFVRTQSGEPANLYGAADNPLLSLNVYTGDLESAIRCMRELRAGTVWINDPLTDNDAGPFGGMKRSGLGRELGQEGLDAFQETKHVHIETKLEVKEWWYPYG